MAIAKAKALGDLAKSEKFAAVQEKKYQDENVIRVQVEAELAALRARLSAEEAARKTAEANLKLEEAARLEAESQA